MTGCGVEIVAGPPCDGHRGKFDDCLAETLSDASFSYNDGEAGSCQFEGHVAMMVVAEPDGRLEPNDSGRIVRVLPAVYLIWTAESGRVTATTVEDDRGGPDIDGARAILENVELRYGLWEAGCDPDDPARHAGCVHYEVCQVPRA